MKEITYRAWDKKHKRMWQFADIDSEHSMVSYAYDINGESYEKMGGENPDIDLTPLQYTGYKDMDGNKIFEKDVLKIIFKDAYSIDRYQGKMVSDEGVGFIDWEDSFYILRLFEKRPFSNKIRAMGVVSSVGDLETTICNDIDAGNLKIVGNFYSDEFKEKEYYGGNN